MNGSGGTGSDGPDRSVVVLDANALIGEKHDTFEARGTKDDGHGVAGMLVLDDEHDTLVMGIGRRCEDLDGGSSDAYVRMRERFGERGAKCDVCHG